MNYSALENPIRRKLSVWGHHQKVLPDEAPLRLILQVIQHRLTRLGHRAPQPVHPGSRSSTQAHEGREVGAYISVQEPPQVRFTLVGIGYQADYRLLDISKIHVGPAVELKRLRFTPLDLSSDQSSVALDHLNLSDGGDS